MQSRVRAHNVRLGDTVTTRSPSGWPIDHVVNTLALLNDDVCINMGEPSEILTGFNSLLWITPKHADWHPTR